MRTLGKRVGGVSRLVGSNPSVSALEGMRIGKQPVSKTGTA